MNFLLARSLCWIPMKRTPSVPTQQPGAKVVCLLMCFSMPAFRRASTPIPMAVLDVCPPLLWDQPHVHSGLSVQDPDGVGKLEQAESEDVPRMEHAAVDLAHLVCLAICVASARLAAQDATDWHAQARMDLTLSPTPQTLARSHALSHTSLTVQFECVVFGRPCKLVPRPPRCGCTSALPPRPSPCCRRPQHPQQIGEEVVKR